MLISPKWIWWDILIKICFYTRQCLAVHRWRSHSGEKPFECTVCSNRFTTPGKLIVHNRIHSGEKPYKCHVSEKAFSKAGNLHTHMGVHTGDKPYDCTYCGKLFKTNSHVKLHVRIHTGAKPHSLFTVHNVLHSLTIWTDICWSHTMKVLDWRVTLVRRNSMSGNLKQHLLRHEGMKPYVCSQCAKCFCTVRDLKSHHLVHSDYKQFCCGLCSKDFKHKHYVVWHLRNVVLSWVLVTFNYVLICICCCPRIAR